MPSIYAYTVIILLMSFFGSIMARRRRLPFRPPIVPLRDGATVDGILVNPDYNATNSIAEDAKYLSVVDILAVKQVLLKRKLPLELVDMCLDLAEYWASSSSVMARRAGQTIRATGAAGEAENLVVARSYPLGFMPSTEPPYRFLPGYSRDYDTQRPASDPPPSITSCDITKDLLAEWSSHVRGEFPCRKIVFKIRSHDQGWGGQGQGGYAHSYSWCDYGIERVQAFAVDVQDQGHVPPWVGLRVELPTSRRRAVEQTLGRESPLGYIACHLHTIRPDTYPPAPSPPSHLAETEAEEHTNPPTTPAPTPINTINTTDSDNIIPLTPRLLHFIHPSTADVLQMNKVAVAETQENKIVWLWTDDVHPESSEGLQLFAKGRGKNTLDGKVVRGLRVGDVLTVWAKARFHGWSNVVEEVSVRVYWAV